MVHQNIPRPYLARIRACDGEMRECYTDTTVLGQLDRVMTLCSPIPRNSGSRKRRYKSQSVATTNSSHAIRVEAHTAILRRLEADIEAARSGHELPVK